ncbi:MULTISPECIES: calcium-binding protein [unclassified Sphingopyxis]|uniref:calcium-binding protein n=1 Tax=unclassified Sphingopyxis TaxID=2614943 RepID=UPI00073637DC|nr:MULTISPECIES: calcium-binding protein [unclassified Sphingopyxis]KTE45037.1 hypothetical protein ATE62_02935 [Sphingopyxis sp. HIX]KTE84745.1 hypothetical protein ATE72_07585 [Sphingopyxis sp. HXXIV]
MAVIPGGPGDDILPGTPDADTIDGFDGNDRITAGEGDDTATGGRGNDVINGEGGNDTLYGNGGSDIISGGTGNDILYAGGGADELRGGDDDDQLYDEDAPGIGGAGGNDKFYGGRGNDLIVINRPGVSSLQENLLIWGDDNVQNPGNDVVDYRNAHADIATVDLFGGADTFILRDTGTGRVDLRLGTGPDQDRIVFMDATPGSAGQAGLVVSQFGTVGRESSLTGLDVVDLSPLLSSLTNWDGANPFLTGHFRLVESTAGSVLLQADFDGAGPGGYSTLIRFMPQSFAQADRLRVSDFGEANFINIPQGGVTRVGDAGDNVLNGSAFDDNLTGAGGNDELYGFADDDVLNGNDGNDLLDGGAGADTMTGGIGDDTYIVDNIGDVVSEGTGGGTDRVVSSINYTLGANVEQLDLRGGNGLAVIGTGNNLDNNIQGNAQNNSLIGGGGNDVLAGGEGNDTLNGGGGNDALLGNDGNDVLNGGPGLDMLDGGAGADRYVFIPSGMSMTQVDRVYFSADDGDVIDLSLLDAVTGGGDSAFSFIGTDAFTGVAGELRYELIGTWDEGPRSGTTYYVSGDVNGDGVADFMIEISMLGPQPLDAGDFIL